MTKRNSKTNFIVVLGVDGAGKSTIIEGLKHVFAHRGFKVESGHLRPGYLPPLGQIFKGSNQPKGEEDNFLDPHAAPPSGSFVSLIRLVYLLIDYLVGYHIVVMPKITVKNSVYISDRYFFDLAVDPSRFRIQLPNWFLDLCISFLPKPDVVLCLVADPESIVNRKPELSKVEIERQYHRLTELSTKYQFSWVDTSCNVEDSLNACISCLDSQLSRIKS